MTHRENLPERWMDKLKAVPGYEWEEKMRKEIAAEYKIPYYAVVFYATQNNIKTVKQNKKSIPMNEETIRWFNEKPTRNVMEIMTKFDVSQPTVWAFVKRNPDLGAKVVKYSKSEYIGKEELEGVENLSMKQALKKYKTTYITMKKALSKHGLSVAQIKPVRTNPLAKEIKEFCESGPRTINDVVERFDLKYPAVYAYIKNHNLPHIKRKISKYEFTMEIAMANKERFENMTRGQIAEEYGIPVGIVSTVCSKCGIKLMRAENPPRKSPVSDLITKYKDQLKEMTIKEMSEKLKCSKQLIYLYCLRNGIEFKRAPYKKPSIKNDRIVETIRNNPEKYRTMKASEIADEFHVSIAYMHHIIETNNIAHMTKLDIRGKRKEEVVDMVKKLGEKAESMSLVEIAKTIKVSKAYMYRLAAERPDITYRGHKRR